MISVCSNTWAEAAPRRYLAVVGSQLVYARWVSRYPQGGASSTDCLAWVRARPFSTWLTGMNLLNRIALRARRIRAAVDAGMTTAEYAVGTVAAVGFAVVLYKVVRSPAVSAALTSLVKSALNAI